MTTEIRLLLLTACIGLLHVIISAAFGTKARGMAWNMSSREDNPPPLTGAAGRLQRAQANFFETFPLFIVAVIALRFADVSNNLTVLGAWLYFLSRAIYFPIYAFGITVIRTIIWAVGLLGLIILLVEGLTALLAMAGQ